MIQKRETSYLSELIKKLKRNIHDLTREETALISQKNLVSLFKQQPRPLILITRLFDSVLK